MAQQGWKIINTVAAMGIGPDGRPAKGQEVTYQLDSGDTSTIFVPDAGFTAANVAQLVTAHASTLVAVKGLTGTAGV